MHVELWQRSIWESRHVEILDRDWSTCVISKWKLEKNIMRM